MLRRNPQTGVWERKEGDGWVAAHNVGDMDLALEDVFSDTGAPDAAAGGSAGEIPGGVGAPGAAGTAIATDEARGTATAGSAAADVSEAPQGLGMVGPNGTADGADADGADPVGDGAGAVDSPGVEDWELPGLVSTDTPRSTSGQRGLRKRLQERIKGKRRAQPAVSGAKRVEVGPRAAKAVGPAVKDSTESRQTRRRVKGAAVVDGKPQRYVSKPPPTLLESRPRWMQDLFEAHFRSEATLVMRRTHNRMKISRTDYAIGWLTLMDKLREDPSIARLKEGNGRA